MWNKKIKLCINFQKKGTISIGGVHFEQKFKRKI
jgi:hypothetical protein